MLTIYSEDHRKQNGTAELIDGKLQPPVEKPERAEQILAAVREAGLGEIVAPDDALPDGVLQAVHTDDYVRFLFSAWDEWVAAHGAYDALPLNWPQRGMRAICPDAIDGKLGYYSFDAGTPITAGTWDAANAAARVAATGAARVCQSGAPVFSLCRPPGHHAARDLYGGYCFLNNAAIAAETFRANGAGRMAIIDVDYHHGNGTQAIYYDRSDTLFISIHADPATEFPFFLGRADETGAGAGEGLNLNFPLPWGTLWDDGFSDALHAACRKIAQFGPDGLVVSLGVDTYDGDPISRFKLAGDDFNRIGDQLAGLGLPTLFVMEGGYAIDALGENVVRVLSGFLQR